jgi:hypothetical protein
MSEVSLLQLVKTTQYFISKMVTHPDFQVLDYYPDLTIADAQTALFYLKCELESHQQPSMESEKQSI